METENVHKQGWICLHRALLDNPIAKRPYYCHLWIHLLLMAQHRTSSFIWNKQVIKICPGQLLTGRKALSEQTGISATTIERVLSYLESGQQIGQQKTNKFRIITIKNWEKYQSKENSGQQNGQQADNRRTHTTSLNNVNKYCPNSIELDLSQFLWSLILERKPDHKKPDLQKWAGYVDKMIHRDHRDPERIRAVIRWCQQDEGEGGKWKGWQNNILSAAKLREKFDKLEMGMGKSKASEQQLPPLEVGEDGLTPRERLMRERQAV